MKRTILLASIVLGMISCKKEEVIPNKQVPVMVIPETNHVRITVNSVAYLDSIKLEYGKDYQNGNLVRSHRDNDTYYLCNLEANLFSVMALNDCNDGYLELVGTTNIRVIYSGDVVVEYLESTL